MLPCSLRVAWSVSTPTATARSSVWTSPPATDGAGWPAFLRSLITRGLYGVQLVVPDVRTSIVNAIGATLPDASWQRGRAYARNLLSQVPESAQPRVATLLRTVFEQPGTDAVQAQIRHALDARIPQDRNPLGHRPARTTGLHRPLSRARSGGRSGPTRGSPLHETRTPRQGPPASGSTNAPRGPQPSLAAKWT